MIPKTIHYCWLSGEPLPEKFQQFLDGWKEKMPDYEFVLWDKNRFDIHSVKWVEQAYNEKKYAFAADYIRAYAVYNEGGFYMDLDVEVLKPFDDLLHFPYVFGAEYDGAIEAGVFGAEPHSPILAKTLEYYKNKDFINGDGSINTTTMPIIMFKQMTLIAPVVISADMRYDENTIHAFPRDFFTAKSLSYGKVETTSNTYTIHHYSQSWVKPSMRFFHSCKVLASKILPESWVIAISNTLKGRN